MISKLEQPSPQSIEGQRLITQHREAAAAPHVAELVERTDPRTAHAVPRPSFLPDATTSSTTQAADPSCGYEPADFSVSDPSRGF